MSVTTLVIGGTGGIGQAVVRRFASSGESVLFTYLRAESTAKCLVDEVAREGGAVCCCQLDVRDDDELTSLVQGCGDDLSTIVFAAASGVHGPLQGMKPKHVDWTFGITARSFLILVSKAIQPLSRNRGCIVTLTSLGSRRVVADYALVGMAKAAMETTVKYAAVEAAASGVRVNCVCAGVVATKAVLAFPDEGRRLLSSESITPLGRLVNPVEVAEAIYWLASPAAAMVTGHNLVVDGGMELVQPLNRGQD